MTAHVMVIHRWRDHHALYADYLDHHTHHVTYVTSEMGRSSIPGDAAGVVAVPATDDLPEVRRAARDLIARFGPPERVVALNEGDLDTAASLRAELGCPGQDPAALAPFRDKLTMVERVAEAGVATPASADAPDVRAVAGFADAHGWPVIVKPRRGTASRGVLRLDGPAELALLADLPPEPRLVQTLCPDAVYHIDGLWTPTGLGPWRASRYLNTCVDFADGQVLGSVEVDDPDLLAVLGEFTAAVAGALSTQPWVFHLEAFVGAATDSTPQVTFLEVGYRVGGAEIPFLWREVHGVDLMAAAVDVQLGRWPTLTVPGEWRTGGWLLVPNPVPPPCRVVAVELALAPGEGPYAQVVPDVGYVVPRVGGYEHVGGRFRFVGSRTTDVEKAITQTATAFRLECVRPA